MKKEPLIYLKNKFSQKFEYRKDVKIVRKTEKGYIIKFNKGKEYQYGSDKVELHSFTSSKDNVRIYEKGKLNKVFCSVDFYGKYLILRNENECSTPINNNDEIEICDLKNNTKLSESVIRYFQQILKENKEVTFEIPLEESENKNPNQISSEILTNALEKIDLFETRSALSNYLDGINPLIHKVNKPFIFPFGCNESQKLAIETVFCNSMSIIEGPPGTGKTQTILNIIANLIIQNKTVAIVSNNNSAVFNVQSKLENYGYSSFAAQLGNQDNKSTFFNTLKMQKGNRNLPDFKGHLKHLEKEISDLDSILTKSFQNKNKLAKLKTELSDVEIEFSHVKKDQPLDNDIITYLDRKFHMKWNPNKALNFKKFLPKVNFETKVSFLNKFKFVLKFGFFDFKNLAQFKEHLPIYVNHKFYELYINRLKNEIQTLENWLATNKESANLKRFVEASKEMFDAKLSQKYKKLDFINFSIENYRNQFDLFISRYPVILSSTLSLHTSIPKGYLFDYLIIDEASQVDIIKSALCFSCSRNAIIVGDSMQLTHIVDEKSKVTAENLPHNYKLPAAYDYIKKNILDSLKTLFANEIKSVLLKEHYRCHPTIIGFCNKKYYNNNLVIMTSMENHPFRIIETNISGERENNNQRQADETAHFILKNYSIDYSKIGVISPFRNHANLLQKSLPKEVEIDTIHKFQGREKEIIIFNTVKNKIGPFIDNPNLINVAVSRAVKEFIVVKSASMDIPHGSNIGDLIRYICYTTDPEKTIIKGQICSVFDLLYKEYNKVYGLFLSSNLSIKGSPAEIIIHKLLTEEILVANSVYSSINLVREYRLRDLVKEYSLFNDEEVLFIKNNSRIDFLLFNILDKAPVLAIEVDGVTFHSDILQQERDNKKDNILKSLGLPLLRLSTNGNDEKSKIIKALDAAMNLN